MAKSQVTKSQKIKEKPVKSVTQLDVAREVQKVLPMFTLKDIQTIVSTEQDVTIRFLKRGKRVVKKNYLTLSPIDVPAKAMKSALDGKEYTVPAKKRVTVKTGEALKNL